MEGDLEEDDDPNIKISWREQNQTTAAEAAVQKKKREDQQASRHPAPYKPNRDSFPGLLRPSAGAELPAEGTEPRVVGGGGTNLGQQGAVLRVPSFQAEASLLEPRLEPESSRRALSPRSRRSFPNLPAPSPW